MIDAEAARAFFSVLSNRIDGRLFGAREPVGMVLIGILTDSHVLIDDVPGVGKTTLVRMLASLLGLRFARVQFTPDLMPSDITGTSVLNLKTQEFEFRPGPIFTEVLLADEINRATPKTQSALLEGMQEGAVTVGGASRPLPAPFFVLATQNPIEMEGTYPLPEAQLDRFMFKLRVRYPAIEELNAIIDRTTQSRPATVTRVLNGQAVLSFRELIREVPIASHVRDFASAIVMATHPQWEQAPEVARRFVRYGASPRGAQALVLGAKVRALAEGRYNVSIEDIKALAAPALRHRVILNFEGEAEGVDTDTLIGRVLESTEATTAQGREPFLR
jgi:MoxR-like ATPase